MSALRTLLVVVFLAPYSVLASILGYPFARLRGSPALLYVLGQFGARVACRLAGIRIELEGLENLRDHRNLVLMPNHVSNLDAAILFGHHPPAVQGGGEEGALQVPLRPLLPALRRLHRRGPPRSRQSKAAITQAAASLKAGSCFIIFPEGTRSPTGELGEFKKGAFVVAIEAGSRIAPVAMMGAERLMPRGRFVIQPGTVRIRVLDPVDAASYSYEDRDRLVAEVRGRIAAALPARGVTS